MEHSTEQRGSESKVLRFLTEEMEKMVELKKKAIADFKRLRK
jgi:hypothetical protein